MRNRTLTFALFYLALVLIGVLAGYFLTAAFSQQKPLPSRPVSTKTAVSLQDQFAYVAEKSMPSVVVVTARKRVAVLDSPYSNIYDYLYGGGKISYRDVPSGQGSGFFVSSKGYILTNYHIVRGQNSFIVVLNDGSEFKAEVVGIDPPSDLAMLKIDAERDFPALKFADMSKLKIGYWAIAIGAPFSLKQTVTVGTVSHKKRGVGMNLHENFVQTDASINPGNSGGPLLNIHGEVIGVNDFILSPSGGNIGLSFAISADLAKRVAEDLIKDGKVDRPWLGVVMRALRSDEKKSSGISKGVLLTGIYRDSPASEAGLKPGDIILSVDNTKIDKPYDLKLIVLSKHPGEKLNLEVLQDGKRASMEIELKRPDFNIYKLLESHQQNKLPGQSCSS